MEMRFFHTLTVVTLWVGQTEETLLEELTMLLVSHFQVCFFRPTYSFVFQKENAMFSIP